jgi:hypothetical protein
LRYSFLVYVYRQIKNVITFHRPYHSPSHG